MRIAPFALACLALICGLARATSAGEPAVVSGAAADTGYFQMSDAGAVWDEPTFDEATPDTSTWFCPPANRWYLQAGALFLNRSRMKNQVIVVDDNNGQSPVLRTRDMDFNNKFAVGPELTLGFRYDGVSAFEATYWGLQHWESHNSVFGSNNLSLPGAIAVTTFDYFLGDTVFTKYQSTTHNVEGNYRQTIFGITMLAGLRYFNMNETLDLRFTDFDSGTSHYRVKTHNNLIGGQIGLGWQRQFGHLGIDLLGKAGLYGNPARLETDMRDLNNTTVLRNFRDNETITSFIGEINLQTTYAITSWFNLRAGYRILWIEGIAQAPNQLDFTDNPNGGNSIIDRSGLYLYGFNVGADVRW